ncbi:MAG: restriction endonuclease subunit S, partial [Bacteroidales bacterium]|nr:restriction endonuclease subunit S [Bacteroidales bacterium]
FIKGFYGYHLCFTLVPNKINNTYFLFLMKYIILDIDRKGSGIQNIGSVKFIKEINLGIPPLSLQNQFAERIQAIEKQKELINQSIKEVQLLFDYTMNKYFN